MTTGKWIAAFAAAGFVGAAVFYASYIRIDAQTSLACPIYPHVTSVGDRALAIFLGLPIGAGLLNAILFATAGWIVVKIVRDMRQKLWVSK